MNGYLIPLAIAGAALSYNPTLLEVGLTRQSQPLHITIPQSIEVEAFECRLGLPYDFRHFTGLQLYFQDEEGELFGPFLSTDYERPEHSGIMKSSNLLADIDCPNFVHKRGRLVVVTPSKRY